MTILDIFYFRRVFNTAGMSYLKKKMVIKGNGRYQKKIVILVRIATVETLVM